MAKQRFFSEIAVRWDKNRISQGSVYSRFNPQKTAAPTGTILRRALFLCSFAKNRQLFACSFVPSHTTLKKTELFENRPSGNASLPDYFFL